MRPDDDTLIEDFGFDPDDLELDPDNDWGPEKVMQVLTDPASMYRLGISRELFISTAERLVEEEYTTTNTNGIGRWASTS